MSNNVARMRPNSREGLARGCVSIVIPPPVSPEPSAQPILERQSAEIFYSSDSDNGRDISAARMQAHNPALSVSYKLRLEFNLRVVLPDSQPATCTAALEHFSVSPY